MKNDLCFLDLETTGLSAKTERIIEVGILKVRDGEIIDTYNTLVDPKIPIKFYITKICGISQEDVLGKPFFEDILDEINRNELITFKGFLQHAGHTYQAKGRTEIDATLHGLG